MQVKGPGRDRGGKMAKLTGDKKILTVDITASMEGKKQGMLFYRKDNAKKTGGCQRLWYAGTRESFRISQKKAPLENETTSQKKNGKRGGPDQGNGQRQQGLEETGHRVG